MDILQVNGITVTGRHRMGVGPPGWWNTKWEAWDTTLEEAGRRAAWTAEVEQLDQEIAKIDERYVMLEICGLLYLLLCECLRVAQRDGV